MQARRFIPLSYSRCRRTTRVEGLVDGLYSPNPKVTPKTKKKLQLKLKYADLTRIKGQPKTAHRCVDGINR